MTKYAKFLAALVGLLTQLVPALALTGNAAHIVSVVLAALTAASVYLVPNSSPAPAVAPVPPTP